MIDILMFIPPQAQLSISFDDYKRFLEIAKQEEQLRIIKLLEPHRITGKSVGGFLGVCSCGESIDDYQLHLIELIKGETNE